MTLFVLRAEKVQDGPFSNLQVGPGDFAKAAAFRKNSRRLFCTIGPITG
jgi:hypothetical protein